MVIIVRLDLDQYTLDQIRAFVIDGVLTPQEATESRAYLSLSEYDQLMTFRSWIKNYRKAG